VSSATVQQPVTPPLIQSASGSSPLRLPLPLKHLSNTSTLTNLSDEELPPTKDKGKKRQRDDEDGPPEDEGKKRKRDEDNEDNYDNDDNYDEDDNDEDDAYRDRYDMSAQSLVQHVTCSTMSVKIILMCLLSAGMGPSRTSRRDYHRPSLWQLRARVPPSSSHSDTIRLGPHRTAKVR
jgi:hypothetical protein